MEHFRGNFGQLQGLSSFSACFMSEPCDFRNEGDRLPSDALRARVERLAAADDGELVMRAPIASWRSRCRSARHAKRSSRRTVRRRNSSSFGVIIAECELIVSCGRAAA